MAVSRDRTGGTGQHNALMRHIVRPCKNCRSLRRPTMAVRGLCRRTHAAVKIIAAVPSVRSGRLLGKNRPTRERKGKSREFQRCWSPRSHTVADEKRLHTCRAKLSQKTGLGLDLNQVTTVVAPLSADETPGRRFR